MKKESSSDYLKGSTLEKWLELLEDERHESKWYWPFDLYKEPYAMECGEWKKFNNYVKSKYPVQFFFRYTLSVFLGRIENAVINYYFILKNKIHNPRKEMRDKVFPPYYLDLPAIIENFHFEVIKEFVEKEKCLEHNVYETAKDKKFKKELLAHYKYITKDRAELSNKILDNNFKVSIKYSALVTKKDESLAFWVIKNKNKLWT